MEIRVVIVDYLQVILSRLLTQLKHLPSRRWGRGTLRSRSLRESGTSPKATGSGFSFLLRVCHLTGTEKDCSFLLPCFGNGVLVVFEGVRGTRPVGRIGGVSGHFLGVKEVEVLV